MKVSEKPNVNTASKIPESKLPGIPDKFLEQSDLGIHPIRSFAREMTSYILIGLVLLISVGTFAYLFYNAVSDAKPSFSTISKWVCESNNLTLLSYDGSSSRVTCGFITPFGDYNVTQSYLLQYDYEKEVVKYQQNKTSGGKQNGRRT